MASMGRTASNTGWPPRGSLYIPTTEPPAFSTAAGASAGRTLHCFEPGFSWRESLGAGLGFSGTASSWSTFDHGKPILNWSSTEVAPRVKLRQVWPQSSCGSCTYFRVPSWNSHSTLIRQGTLMSQVVHCTYNVVIYCSWVHALIVITYIGDGASQKSIRTARTR